MFRRVLFLSIALLILSFLVVSCTSQPVAPVVTPPSTHGREGSYDYRKGGRLCNRKTTTRSNGENRIP